MTEVLRRGWLSKKSGGKKKLSAGTLSGKLGKWDKRFFELHADGTLKYFKRAGDDEAAGVVDVIGAQITPSGDGHTFTVGTAARLLTLKAEVTKDRDAWCTALEDMGAPTPASNLPPEEEVPYAANNGALLPQRPASQAEFYSERFPDESSRRESIAPANIELASIPSKSNPPPAPSFASIDAHPALQEGSAASEAAAAPRRGLLSSLLGLLGCSCCAPSGALSDQDSASFGGYPSSSAFDGGAASNHLFQRTGGGGGGNNKTARERLGKPLAGDAPVSVAFMASGKKVKCALRIESASARGGLLILKAGKAWSSAALQTKKLTQQQHEAPLHAYASALWRVHEAYARDNAGASGRGGGGTGTQMTPAQFATIVHFIPVLPKSSPNKLMIKGFLKAKPQLASEFGFLMPIVDSSKARQAFFAAVPEMKRAVAILVGPHSAGRETEVARTVQACLERAFAAAVNRV